MPTEEILLELILCAVPTSIGEQFAMDRGAGKHLSP